MLKSFTVLVYNPLRAFGVCMCGCALVCMCLCVSVRLCVPLTRHRGVSDFVSDQRQSSGTTRRFSTRRLSRIRDNRKSETPLCLVSGVSVCVFVLKFFRERVYNPLRAFVHVHVHMSACACAVCKRECGVCMSAYACAVCKRV